MPSEQIVLAHAVRWHDLSTIYMLMNFGFFFFFFNKKVFLLDIKVKIVIFLVVC